MTFLQPWRTYDSFFTQGATLDADISILKSIFGARHAWRE